MSLKSEKKKREIETLGLEGTMIVQTPNGKVFLEAKCVKCDSKIALSLDKKCQEKIEKKNHIDVICETCKYRMRINATLLDNFIRHFENRKRGLE